MQRVGKGRGAKCEVLPATKESCEEVVRKLERFKAVDKLLLTSRRTFQRDHQLGTTRPAFQRHSI